MFKRLGKDAYICDTKEDLKNISETELGAECYIIKEGTTYLMMSTGEWVRQGGSVSISTGDIDLSNYVTKEEISDKMIMDKNDIEEAIAEAMAKVK